MNRIGRWLVVIAVVLQLFPPMAHAGAGDVNARNVAAYIHQLKMGANPDRLQRPTLRHLGGSGGSEFNRKLTEEMDKAEALARAGQQEEIPEIEVTSGRSGGK